MILGTKYLYPPDPHSFTKSMRSVRFFQMCLLPSVAFWVTCISNKPDLTSASLGFLFFSDRFHIEYIFPYVVFPNYYVITMFLFLIFDQWAFSLKFHGRCSYTRSWASRLSFGPTAEFNISIIILGPSTIKLHLFLQMEIGKGGYQPLLTPCTLNNDSIWG